MFIIGALTFLNFETVPSHEFVEWIFDLIPVQLYSTMFPLS
jgi:hypothetical protein